MFGYGFHSISMPLSIIVFAFWADEPIPVCHHVSPCVTRSWQGFPSLQNQLTALRARFGSLTQPVISPAFIMQFIESLRWYVPLYHIGHISDIILYNIYILYMYVCITCVTYKCYIHEKYTYWKTHTVDIIHTFIWSRPKESLVDIYSTFQGHQPWISHGICSALTAGNATPWTPWIPWVDGGMRDEHLWWTSAVRVVRYWHVLMPFDA